MPTYIVQVKQGEDTRFTIEKPIVVCEIRIKQRKDELEFRQLHYDIADANRLNILFNLSTALTLIFGVSLTTYWGRPPKIKGVHNDVFSSIKYYKDMRKLGFNQSSVSLEQHHSERIQKYTKALNSLDTNIANRVSAGFSWYNKGLSEIELANKFIYFYITLEFLGTYSNPNKQSPTAKVKAILNKYSNNKELTDKIISTRHEIFHEGIKRADIIPYIQTMDSAIREAFKDIVFNKISPK